ncbi:Stress-response A/B barrel domain-containing protein [Psidium guajava]|nr:Stress-response A/B barrel domain-containing protein [Psidium guajava]
MEAEAKGLMRLVLLVKFKVETAPDLIKQFIERYSNLVNLVEPLKSWHMCKDVSIENLPEGFTHVFQLEFESPEGAAEYHVHPAHVEVHEMIWPHVEKLGLIDYKPTAFPDLK